MKSQNTERPTLLCHCLKASDSVPDVRQGFLRIKFLTEQFPALCLHLYNTMLSFFLRTSDLTKVMNRLCAPVPSFCTISNSSEMLYTLSNPVSLGCTRKGRMEYCAVLVTALLKVKDSPSRQISSIQGLNLFQSIRRMIFPGRKPSQPSILKYVGRWQLPQASMSVNH